eukprot:7223721-Pyramimonas_sp.AAC.1
MAAFRSPIGSSTDAPGVPACGSPTQCSVSWSHRELHRMPHWGCPHAVPPPREAFRGRIGSSTEGPGGGARM